MAARVREAMPPNAVTFYIFLSPKGHFSPFYDTFILQKGQKFTALHATRSDF